MHAILIAIGSAGDVFPFIGLARTLKLRGHRVSLCTIPVFRDAVEQHGIAFVPLSDELTYRRTMGDPRLWDPKTSFGVLWQAIAGMIEPVYEYVSAQRHDDIVVVGSLWALGARIAHEKYGIPYLSAQVSPSTLLSAHLPPVHPKFNVPEQMPLAMRKLLWRCIERFKLDRTCAPEINAVRRKVGLETPVKRIFTQWMHSPQGVVCLFPAWFAPPQQDWPQPLHMTGFPLFDGSIPGTPLDDELQRFLDQGSRPLVFTQGSTEHLQGDFYAMALRALERLGARGIFLTGAGQEPLRGLPNHVLQRAYAPLGALLPSCAGLVHPGGIGAMSLALAAGVLHEFWLTRAFSWVSLVTALGYPPYFMLRRRMGVDALSGFVFEMLFLLPLALAALYWLGDESQAFREAPRLWLLLPMLGLISALAFGAMMASSRLLPMGLFGILSYVEPVLLFLVAVLFLGEAFRPEQLWTYAPIWLAVLLTGWDSARLLRKQARRGI